MRKKHRSIVLSNSYCVIMNKIFYVRTAVLKKMTCAVLKKLQNFRRAMCKFLLCKFPGNVKIILINPNPTSSLRILPGKDVYFNVH